MAFAWCGNSRVRIHTHASSTVDAEVEQQQQTTAKCIKRQYAPLSRASSLASTLSRGPTNTLLIHSRSQCIQYATTGLQEINNKTNYLQYPVALAPSTIQDVKKLTARYYCFIYKFYIDSCILPNQRSLVILISWFQNFSHDKFLTTFSRVFWCVCVFFHSAWNVPWMVNVHQFWNNSMCL